VWRGRTDGVRGDKVCGAHPVVVGECVELRSKCAAMRATANELGLEVLLERCSNVRLRLLELQVSRGSASY
jgi:acyl-CoA hydrolase